MLAIDAGTGETILESRSDELFRPASTVKLITTLLAFRTLGPSRIILTHVVADHAAGAVYLIGSGAPLIEPDDIERAAVEASAELGGGSWRLFFDTSVFADSNRCPGWEQADWARVYCPPVEALTLGDNVLELVISSRGGAVTVEEYPELPGLQLRGSVNIRAGGEPTARPEGWETASPVIVLGGAIPPTPRSSSMCRSPGRPGSSRRCSPPSWNRGESEYRRSGGDDLHPAPYWIRWR